MVVDEDHGYLLGVTFVGPGVEELIHSATIAAAGQTEPDAGAGPAGEGP
jgi:pyruvate/2-oxoglutarate dehydrogenase complex dihydrolipoamide dehydrogenase (E3) component